MHSSTSNFRRAVVIAAVVLAVFCALEWVTRRFLFRSSKDLSRFTGYAARATELMAKPGPLVVFIGNSITEHAVDTNLVANEVHGAAEAFTADSSHINTWIWIANAELWRQNVAPDLLVVTFHGGSLSDGQRLEIGRLAQFFTTSADWPELFATDLTSLDQRADLVLSSVWATYAVADRIKQRVLGLIPNYTTYAQAENKLIFTEGLEHVDARTVQRSWSTLDRFLARAKERHVHVLFVAFPTRPEDATQRVPYEIAPELPRRIQAAGMTLLDLRHVRELDPQRHYDDDIHLNEAGREVYTRRLLAELKRLGLPRR